MFEFFRKYENADNPHKHYNGILNYLIVMTGELLICTLDDS